MGSIQVLLHALASPNGASAKAVAEMVDSVNEKYENLTRDFGGWLDEEWMKVAVAHGTKSFDVGGSYGMTALQAAFAASIVVINAAGREMPRGSESEPGDLARFAVKVQSGLAGVSLDEISGHLGRECALIDATAPTVVAQVPLTEAQDKICASLADLCKTPLKYFTWQAVSDNTFKLFDRGVEHQTCKNESGFLQERDLVVPKPGGRGFRINPARYQVST